MPASRRGLVPSAADSVTNSKQPSHFGSEYTLNYVSSAPLWHLLASFAARGVLGGIWGKKKKKAFPFFPFFSSFLPPSFCLCVRVCASPDLLVTSPPFSLGPALLSYIEPPPNHTPSPLFIMSAATTVPLSLHKTPQPRYSPAVSGNTSPTEGSRNASPHPSTCSSQNSRSSSRRRESFGSIKEDVDGMYIHGRARMVSWQITNTS